MSSATSVCCKKKHATFAVRETFASVAAWRTDDVVLRVANGELPTAKAHFVSDNYFSTLGLAPTIGAGLPPESNEPVAIISHLLWQRSYGGTSDVIGKTIDVNGVRATIVGVAPERFRGALPTPTSNVVWMTLPNVAAVMRTSAAAVTSNDSTSLSVFGRLGDGVTPTQATTAVRLVADRALASRALPTTPTKYDTDVAAMIGKNMLPQNDDALLIAALFGAVALLVLLITCTNVSALVIGAAIARRHEVAVRLSLGASRARIVRQLVTENTLLALGGGFLGLSLYSVLAWLAEREVPEMTITPDWKTVAFTAAVALGTGILFGLSPALHATRRGVADVLKDSDAGHSGRSRLQRGFVIAQIALTQPLLVGMAIMLGFVPLISGRMANDVDQHLITLSVAFRADNATPKAQRASAQRLMDRLRVMPGVVGVFARGRLHP